MKVSIVLIALLILKPDVYRAVWSGTYLALFKSGKYHFKSLEYKRTIQNKGYWEMINDSIVVLNSKKKLSSCAFIQVSEQFDSTLLPGLTKLYLNKDTQDYILPLVKCIEVNNNGNVIYLKSRSFVESQNQDLKSFVIKGYNADYMIYTVRDSQSNVFYINELADKYPENYKSVEQYEYFIDEQLMKFDDTLVLDGRFSLVKQ